MTNAATVAVFDHGILNSKAICQSFLREFGIQRDWARCTLGEMRTMLKRYPHDKMFAAAKTIVEREGDEFVRSEYELLIDLDDAEEQHEQAEAEHETEASPLQAHQAEQKPAAKPAPAPVPAAKPAARPQATEPTGDDVNEVAAALARLMSSGKAAVNPAEVAQIATDVFASHHDALMQAVQALVDQGIKGVAPRELLVKTERSEVKIDGLQHFAFERLLRACSAVGADGHRLNVWLYGPPGTGKTTGARNVAKALDLPFYCTGALLTKYDITGFVDAGGKLVRTPFREAWENGGVYLFDEIDGSAPAAVVAFNAALANGIMAFPDGMVERHPDCVVIAAANTTGLGATAEFTGRMKLDMATLDRFVFIEWGIDEKIESALSPNKEWAATVQRVRANVQAKGIKGVSITPRATAYGASLIAAGLSVDDVKQMVLRKSMSPDQWAMVAA